MGILCFLYVDYLGISKAQKPLIICTGRQKNQAESQNAAIAPGPSAYNQLTGRVLSELTVFPYLWEQPRHFAQSPQQPPFFLSRFLPISR